MSKRQHKKKHSSAIRVGELATPERRRQLGGVATEVVDRDANGKVYIERHRAEYECVVDFYWRTRKINDPQRAAAIKLREIYIHVSHGFDSTNLGGALVDAGIGNHEKQIATYLDSLNQLKAARAKLTPAQRTILRNVCGYDEYAEDKDDKETLARGLDRLAIFWGFMTPDKK
jgi:hypothetical protein